MNKEQKRVYLVGGVNGVGKSTFLRELTFLYPEFEVIHGSGLLLKWLGLLPGDYDELRKLPDGLKKIETERMMEGFLKERKSGGKTLIVDAHYFHYKEGNLIDVTGEWMGNLDAIFVITAPARVILARVEKDRVENEKHRDLFPHNSNNNEEKLTMLNKFLSETIKKAVEVSERFSLPCFFIDNSNEGVGIAIEEFLNYHTSLQSET